MTPAVRAYLSQIGARGNQAMRGTEMARERARKAAKARWAKVKEQKETK